MLIVFFVLHRFPHIFESNFRKNTHRKPWLVAVYPVFQPQEPMFQPSKGGQLYLLPGLHILYSVQYTWYSYCWDSRSQEPRYPYPSSLQKVVTVSRPWILQLLIYLILMMLCCSKSQELRFPASLSSCWFTRFWWCYSVARVTSSGVQPYSPAVDLPDSGDAIV